MNKLVNFWNTIKKLWKNKRTRSALILGLYLIFIALIVGFIRVNKDQINYENKESNIIDEVSTDDKLKYFKNYKYLIEITSDNGEIYRISTYNEENNIKYYIFNANTNNYDIIDALPSEIINLDLEYILYLINNNEEEYTTNYKEGTSLNNYNLKLNNNDTKVDVKYNKNNYIYSIETTINNFKYNIEFSA